ncbi:Oxidoreductase family, NAD-binding Rossmann fold [Chlamydia abortus]|uniref:Gfo/Idh/MocA family protein n=1 Tax=Paenibacillus residui TaxID=629724 RepID=A0ABW3D6W3_9BACL|nr:MULTISPECIES: Gfo/Idh/MocA family oxidoreductase [Paenibacillaceae]SHE11609.1 Oxidoreductase family, NAD-binding Rossmann fold [Chlamydia abortus]
MDNNIMKIGMIGLDTSHVPAFAELLNDANHAYHVPGAKVVVAYPGGSEDFELSISRVEGYTETLRNQYGVQIVNSPEEVAELSDAILLESVDGRVHREQFARIAPYGKPVFIDKPFTLSSQDAAEMFKLARQHNIPLMSCSALRYAEGLSEVLAAEDKGAIIGMDVYGPMAIQPTQPGLFWYGIHTVEMLFRTLGKGCLSVTATKNEDHDLVVGVWKDGRIATLRGNRKGNNRFGALIHREQDTQFVDVYAHPKPYYASMLERVMKMFASGVPDIDPEETEQIIRFIEAANESRETGKTVLL